MRTITLLDGAVGTSLWAVAGKYGIEEVPVWIYNMEHPELVEELTRSYLNAGSEIILTNTFGVNSPMVQRLSNYNVKDIITKAVGITKNVLSGTNAKTCLAVGPLSELIEPYGDMTVEECTEIYDEIIRTGVEAGAECILIQTFIDLEMMKIAADVAKGFEVPVFCSMSFEEIGKTMFGNSVQDVIDALEPKKIDAIGINCSLGPEMAIPIIKEFYDKTDLPLIFKPNAGKPVMNNDGSFSMEVTPKEFVEKIKPALPYVRYIGGCCGSDPLYIKELKKIVDEERGTL